MDHSIRGEELSSAAVPAPEFRQAGYTASFSNFVKLETVKG
jgi:hypothetical protein